MKIQLPKTCPVCGAEVEKTNYFYKYKCGLEIFYKGELHIYGTCADKILVKFGTSEVSGYEEKDNDSNAN